MAQEIYQGLSAVQDPMIAQLTHNDQQRGYHIIRRLLKPVMASLIATATLGIPAAAQTAGASNEVAGAIATTTQSYESENTWGYDDCIDETTSTNNGTFMTVKATNLCREPASDIPDANPENKFYYLYPRGDKAQHLEEYGNDGDDNNFWKYPNSTWYEQQARGGTIAIKAFELPTAENPTVYPAAYENYTEWEEGIHNGGIILGNTSPLVLSYSGAVIASYLAPSAKGDPYIFHVNPSALTVAGQQSYAGLQTANARLESADVDLTIRFADETEANTPPSSAELSELDTASYQGVAQYQIEPGDVCLAVRIAC